METEQPEQTTYIIRFADGEARRILADTLQEPTAKSPCFVLTSNGRIVAKYYKQYVAGWEREPAP